MGFRIAIDDLGAGSETQARVLIRIEQCVEQHLVSVLQVHIHVTEVEPGCRAANDERADYLRATLEMEPDGPVATPVPDQDSSLMAPLARAHCLVIREPHAPAAVAGSPCVILKLGL